MFKIAVGGKNFRVSVKDGGIHPPGLFVCRDCLRGDRTTQSRYVKRVYLANYQHVWEQLDAGTADYDLAANTFRREHKEAGPLCEDCFSFTASGGGLPQPTAVKEEARRVQP